MARRNLFGPSTSRKPPNTAPRPAKRRARWVGPVSTAKAPKRKLPKQVGTGPDPALLALFTDAADLGECFRRLTRAYPELDHKERIEKLREHFRAVNTRWLKSPARLERVKLVARHSPGDELDYDDGIDDPPPPKPPRRRPPVDRPRVNFEC